MSPKARALQWLSQREHSRSELRRKLLAHARRADRAAGADGLQQHDARPAAGPEIDALLDELEARGLLSQARFAESRIHARSARFGNVRIRRELAQHGVALDPAAAAALAESEFERARKVWERKFKSTSADPAERARQSRFLAGRGFSADVIQRLMRLREAD